MGENISELGYKNHDPFFINLNRNFQTLLVSVSKARRDLTQLEELFVLLDTFYIFYIPYIENNIENELEKMAELVYSIRYKTFIKNKLINEQLLTELNNSLDSCRKMIKLIMKGLHDNQLFPQVNKIDTSTPSAVRGIK